ncbi:MAG: ATP-binding protein [Azoarcus sp.]|jgi:predicted AAA+ superfamily ATPase|nr:ATP-binding protein [Azoarcus sp.]
MPIFPRLLKTGLLAALQDTPVVCLLGPRQCGKTTLARTLEPDYAYLSFDDDATLTFAQADPAGFVAALPPRVILDEIQRVPELLRAVKLAVDVDRRPGRFVLTGSANLMLLPTLGDSLAGRMEVLQLHPLTAAEQAFAPGRFLSDLLAGALKPSLSSTALADGEDLARRVVAGGFPEAVSRPESRARAWHRAYVRALLERDVRDVARVRDTAAIARLLEVLALRTAELLNVSSLGKELDLRRDTVEHYLAICERLYLLRRLPPWHRNEAKRLIKTPKAHLLDSGLAATLAGLSAADWNARRDRFGHLLESFVAQQLIAQAEAVDPDLRFWHYRDKDKVEVDFVITRGRQTWGVEVKAAATVTPADGHGLRRLAERAGPDWQGGVLLHAGNSAFPLQGDRNLAAPLAWLWEM